MTTETVTSTRSHTVTVHGKKSVSMETYLTTTVYPVTSAPMSTETIFSTRLHTVTAHGSKSVSTETYPAYTTKYPVSTVPMSAIPVVSKASGVDVKPVVASSIPYAPVYSSSLVSVPAKPVSASTYYPVSGMPSKPAAGTGYSATYSTPYAAQFTGSAGKMGASAFALVGAVFFVIFI
jgi:hypothetical protein